MNNDDLDDNVNSQLEDIPHWKHHRYIEFINGAHLLQWVSHDNEMTCELSSILFNATVDCIKDNIEKSIALTLCADDRELEIIVYKKSIDTILSTYIEGLLKIEDYERLNTVKQEVLNIGLDFPNITF